MTPEERRARVEYVIKMAEQGATVLSGVCVDASALYGVLDRMRELGLDLLDVESFPVAP